MIPPTDRPLRVGIWTAVSSREQAADDKASLPDQEQAGRDLAAALNACVVAVYRVPGHTRDIWDWHEAETDIPAYRALREDLQAGRLDLLWILDPDRAGRDPALAQQMFSLANKSGCEIYTATAPHPIGQQSPGHRYLYAIQAVRAGEDQALRVRRYHSGMTNRVHVRGLIPNNCPFWLDPVRDPVTGKTTAYRLNDRAAALDLLTGLYLAGESYTEITRRLNASPYPPPAAGRWCVSTVRHILTHDTPAGLISLAGVPRPEPSPAVPARWDPATFAAVHLLSPAVRRPAAAH